MPLVEPLTQQDKVVAELDSPIPRSAVSQRDGGGGRQLSYLEGWYVIDRLNKVLGHGQWAYSSEVSLIREDTITRSTKYGDKTSFNAHYLAKVRLVVKYPNGETTEFTDVGYGDGSDPLVPGKAHELAMKESVTDGIKRCAKNLGMSMGLALYDKGQVNVEEDDGTQATKTGGGDVSSTTESKAPASTGHGPKALPTRERLNELISANSRVIIETKRATKEELVDKLKTYGVSSKEELNFDQALELYNYLKGVLA